MANFLLGAFFNMVAFRPPFVFASRSPIDPSDECYKGEQCYQSESTEVAVTTGTDVRPTSPATYNPNTTNPVIEFEISPSNMSFSVHHENVAIAVLSGVILCLSKFHFSRLLNKLSSCSGFLFRQTGTKLWTADTPTKTTVERRYRPARYTYFFTVKWKPVFNI